MRYAVRRHRLLRHWWLIAGLAALLGACATRPAVAPVPALTALPAAGPQTQRLTFEHRGQRHELLGVLRHDDASLRLVLLSPQGQRLLTLVRDAQGSRFMADTAFEAPFSADWLASRLSWSLWSAPALEEAFRDSDWRLHEASGVRTIRYRNRPIARITGNAECRIIDDIEGGYRLHIAPVNVSNDRTKDACPVH